MRQSPKEMSKALLATRSLRKRTSRVAAGERAPQLPPQPPQLAPGGRKARRGLFTAWRGVEKGRVRGHRVARQRARCATRLVLSKSIARGLSKRLAHTTLGFCYRACGHFQSIATSSSLESTY